MKTVKVMTTVEVPVTEEEFMELHTKAFDGNAMGCPFYDIRIPEWMVDKIKVGKIIPDGYISKYTWVDRNNIQY